MKLYELTDELLDIMRMVADGEMTMEQLQDQIEATELELHDKLESCCAMRKNLKAEAEQFKAEAKRLSEIAAQKAKAVDKLSDYIAHCMASIELNKFSKGVHSVSIGKPGKVVVIDNVDHIPDEFFKVSKVADKTAIKEALKAGEIPGAHMGDGKPRITFK